MNCSFEQEIVRTNLCISVIETKAGNVYMEFVKILVYWYMLYQETSILNVESRPATWHVCGHNVIQIKSYAAFLSK